MQSTTKSDLYIPSKGTTILRDFIRGRLEIATGIEIQTGVENIFDAYYRDHLNLAQLPEPGRNAYLTISVNLPLGGHARKIDPKNVRTTTINVDGMACEFCARTVRERLTRIEGIVSTDVRFGEDLVNVSFDPAHVTVRDLIRVINQLGYRASLPGDEGVDRGRRKNAKSCRICGYIMQEFD